MALKGRNVSSSQLSSASHNFLKVINLGTREAMISSPEALVVREVPRDQDAPLAVMPPDEAVTLGQGYLIVRSRKRITVDGGHSITATNPYLDTDRMPKSSKGSTFSSPESVTDPIEPLNLFMDE